MRAPLTTSRSLFMRSAFYAAPESGERKIAYPNLLFDCNIIDGRAMLRSVLPPPLVTTKAGA